MHTKMFLIFSYFNFQGQRFNLIHGLDAFSLIALRVSRLEFRSYPVALTRTAVVVPAFGQPNCVSVFPFYKGCPRKGLSLDFSEPVIPLTFEFADDGFLYVQSTPNMWTLDVIQFSDAKRHAAHFHLCRCQIPSKLFIHSPAF